MMALVRSSVSSMLGETALDMTRLGQRMAGKALVPRPLQFQTADVVPPNPDPTATIDPSSVLSGQMYVRRYAEIGPNVVIRGESGVVDIGRYSKIGDGSVLLATARNAQNPFARMCVVGHNAKIGNRVTLVSCRVEKNATIGDNCKVCEGSIVEAGAVLEPNTVIPAGRLVPKETRWGGNPAKYLGPAHSDHH